MLSTRHDGADLSATLGPGISCRSLSPFGLELETRGDATVLTALRAPSIHAWILAHRLLVLRGVTLRGHEELLAFGRTLGRLDPDAVSGPDDARVCAAAGIAVGDDDEVPLHFDPGALGAPRYLVFHCDEAPRPGTGGETFFSDLAGALAGSSPRERASWVGAGATAASALPPSVMGGVPRRLYAPRFCYPHSWRAGDVVLADNRALLHGRAPMCPRTRRSVWRVNVL